MAKEGGTLQTQSHTSLLIFDSQGVCSAAHPAQLERYVGLHFDDFSFFNKQDVCVFTTFCKQAPYITLQVELEQRTFIAKAQWCQGNQSSLVVSLSEHFEGYRQRSNAERLEALIEGTQAGTWEWNMQTGEVVLNERWANIIGYTLDELSPISIDTWLLYAHPEDLHASDAAFDRHFSGEDPVYQCDVRMKHKQGHWVWVRDCGKVVTRTADDKPEWISGTHIDITQRVHDLEQLTQVRNELKTIIDSVPAAIYKAPFDEPCCFSFISSQISHITGYNRIKFVQSPHWWREHIHPEDLDAQDTQTRHWRKEGAQGVFKSDFRFRHKDGYYIWLTEYSQRMQTTANNGQDYLVGSLTDKSENVSLSNRLDAFAQVLPGMIYQFALTAERSWHFPYISEGCTRIFEVAPEAVQQDPASLLTKIAHNDRQRVVRSILNSAQSLDDWECEFKVELEDNEEKWLFAHAIPKRQLDGTVLWSGMVIDITDRKSLELTLLRESTTDPLTGLYNRRHFNEQLQQQLARAERDGTHVSLMIIDFDLFKQINDQYGHHAGDIVLKEATMQISAILRKYDIFARIGGEEFSVILPNTSLAQARHVAEKVRRQVEHCHIQAHEHSISVTTTIGVASTEQTTAHPGALLKQADNCLYQGKHQGRNCVVSD
ncbi:sensor domain-containing diguanylate cyclase [Pseudoalteromonas ruthenica]|nr:sensor domain-containing diguanylate cyclase [Pseudoalteromonas ruthenica]TMO96654.1 sensor domain-containing diguanylate cyclase [Pseudoalteromonas ruthenica]TMP05854.1 sensor domain-containing diguanylate cyclase [Pseudoalteromonas ruthenica]TMP05958.1 sensor domain-containing diguanylate cyclase [Pseudoalteromonas ruthenica]